MNIIFPLNRKTRITYKQAVDSFQYNDNWDFAISVGYCDLQYFISRLGNIARFYLSPFAYSASNYYGWRCDYYIIPKRIVLKKTEDFNIHPKVDLSTDIYILATGYDVPSKLKSPNYESVRALEKYSQDLYDQFCKEEDTVETRQKYVNILLEEFDKLVKDAHNGKN